MEEKILEKQQDGEQKLSELTAYLKGTNVNSTCNEEGTK